MIDRASRRFTRTDVIANAPRSAGVRHDAVRIGPSPAEIDSIRREVANLSTSTDTDETLTLDVPEPKVAKTIRAANKEGWVLAEVTVAASVPLALADDLASRALRSPARKLKFVRRRPLTELGG